MLSIALGFWTSLPMQAIPLYFASRVKYTALSIYVDYYSKHNPTLSTFKKELQRPATRRRPHLYPERNSPPS